MGRYILEPGHVVAYVIAFGVIPGAHVYSDMQYQSVQKCLEKTFFVRIFVCGKKFLECSSSTFHVNIFVSYVKYLYILIKKVVRV